MAPRSVGPSYFMKTKIILTCEHGGAQIPAAYKNLFKNQTAILKTHRALDIGALAIAKRLGRELKSPLYYSVVTRLLIDLNRFLTSRTLFSKLTSFLGAAEKQKIIAKYYSPHWQKVELTAKVISKANCKVIHVAVHSMTDHLNGQTREMQLALLYYPRRPQEKKFSTLWIRELRKEFPGFKISRNRPYHGAGEGLTSHLRKQIKDELYVGIELEMNQGYLKLLSSAKARKAFSQSLAASLQRAVANLTSVL